MCSDYCDLLLANCPTRYATDYTGADDCRTQCADMPLGNPSNQGGDTLWCRFNHADLAEGEGDVSVHCIHAGLNPPEVCNF